VTVGNVPDDVADKLFRIIARIDWAADANQVSAGKIAGFFDA